MRASYALISAALAGILLLFWCADVDAHRHDRPDLDQWFKGLASSNGAPCCDGTDGAKVDDVDCVRLEGIWRLVPDRAVVVDPNRYGPAIVWMIWYGDGVNLHKQLFIRCFMPGAGA